MCWTLSEDAQIEWLQGIEHISALPINCLSIRALKHSEVNGVLVIWAGLCLAKGTLPLYAATYCLS